MRHFDHLSDDTRRRLFWREPEPFTRDSPRETLAVALGATLYMPATRPRLAHDLVRRAGQGVVSSVVCLEDSIADEELPAAQANAIAQLRELAVTGGGPLVFVRVRQPEQIAEIAEGLGEHLHVLSGFVLPKFAESTGAAYLDALDDTAAVHGRRLWGMPVIESPEMIHRETRDDQLLAVRGLLDKHRDSVLAVRTGATDLSGVYGIRRGRDLSIYDVRLVADVLTDVVNVLGRADGTGFVVTGPVWEYYGGNERLFKPRLRQAPFQASDAEELRADLITQDLDGLIREVVLDAANGLTGKTVIHPSHVPVVHALSVVPHEEFVDASDVLGRTAGASASAYRNKMNESRPHRAWAERVLTRAKVFGVAEADVGFVDLLGAEDGR
ncbi:HpcH/HpaI aldolase/citrate lyase family protein [Cellulomonas sp. PhB150]|uniref:HpcH/HpaI aldolase/citrate lyase family protein n=1 Tax=Cellulomonas sp. PhB150 TaxID=2485188 RepID=UPI000F4A0CA3|nr:HpcH/HpaI aldolase/citrate lyase family protein [Cellulomonas sp. PhB150]ROS23017.1 citrate lyase beta subunit [Cellulomonas sp. PhB150]